VMIQNSPVADGVFEAWVAPLLPRAAGYAFAIVRNREDAEDAVQEALVKAYRQRDRFDRSRSFKCWFFAIVRNCCRDLLRCQQTRPAAGIDPALSSIPVVDRHAEREQKDLLEWSLRQLAAPHREILELRYYADCSYRDIAGILGIPEGTVMSRLHTARQALAASYRRENA
jgi:RNA polymerase sigma-70 factor (ECF subfamily)